MRTTSLTDHILFAILTRMPLPRCYIEEAGPVTRANTMAPVIHPAAKRVVFLIVANVVIATYRNPDRGSCYSRCFSNSSCAAHARLPTLMNSCSSLLVVSLSSICRIKAATMSLLWSAKLDAILLFDCTFPVDCH